MKKILVLLLLMFASTITVNAGEIYYSNKYGVEFNKEQYEFFTEMYYEGYQEYMTIEDFKYFSENEMSAELVETNYSSQSIMPMAELATGTKKTLKISKISGGTNAFITIVADWFQNPSTKSNDVIGARFASTDLFDNPTTTIVSSSGTKKLTNIDRQTNGFGQTLLISGTGIKITQTYKVRTGGTVYASYQRAKQVISAADSRKYTISSDGYGSVFKFNGKGVSIYDNSEGVSMSIWIMQL